MPQQTTQHLFRFTALSHSPTDVRWPDDSVEQMDEVVHLGTEWNGRSVTVTVGRVTGGRYAFDRDRERIRVIVGGNVQAEFVETDDYATTGELMCVLKQPGGNRHAWDPADVPPEYRENFTIVSFADLIRQKGTYRCLGVVVADRDYETMAAYGLLRWRDRKRT